MGFVLALFVNFLAFLFLCCAKCMGIQGKRKPLFVIGATFGIVCNVAVYLVLAVFVWREVKNPFET